MCLSHTVKFDLRNGCFGVYLKKSKQPCCNITKEEEVFYILNSYM